MPRKVDILTPLSQSYMSKTAGIYTLEGWNVASFHEAILQIKKACELKR